LIWHLYELVDPRDGVVFYVGLTSQPSTRLKAHGHNRGGVCYARCREISAAGLAPIMNLLSEHTDKQGGLIEEANQIRSRANLINRAKPKPPSKRGAYCRDWMRKKRAREAIPKIHAEIKRLEAFLAEHGEL
jgi:hypothetical protein